MKFKETIITALKALVQNKMRTFLTMLGVIIGVFAVVTLVGLVQGVKNYVEDQFSELGSNLLFVYPGSAGWANDPALSFSNNKLEEKHVNLIKEYAPDQIEDITPFIMLGETVKYKTKSFYASITGASTSYESIGGVTLTSGRFFTKAEERSKAKVAVIGPLVSKELFGDIDPIGKKIKAANKSFDIVGVMEEKGPDYDEIVIVPYTTVEDTWDIKNYTMIEIKLSSSTDMHIAEKNIELALLRDLQSDDFTLFSQEELLSTVQNILGILTIGLGAIAAISLVVGGIGIMNIMLVSVTERIDEIGLRKALGATPLNIGLQFMVESVVMGIIGGTLGVSLGWGSMLVAQNWLRAEIPFWAIGLAFGFSIIVGTVFGTYPAIKASKMDPIVALRYE